MIKIVVFCALGALVATLLFLWLITRVRYRIGSRHVKVLLFGICVRRVALASIESVSKRRRDGLAEHWWSTLRPKHRMLVLRRSRGLCRNFVVTPKNRYIFKTDLERAMRRVGVAMPRPQDESAEAEVLPPEERVVQAPSSSPTRSAGQSE